MRTTDRDQAERRCRHARQQAELHCARMTTTDAPTQDADMAGLWADGASQAMRDARTKETEEQTFLAHTFAYQAHRTAYTRLYLHPDKGTVEIDNAMEWHKAEFERHLKLTD